jgi:hypothetical protein
VHFPHDKVKRGDARKHKELQPENELLAASIRPIIESYIANEHSTAGKAAKLGWNSHVLR